MMQFFSQFLRGVAFFYTLQKWPHFEISTIDLNLNLNSLLVKRQIDNPSPGAVTGGN